MATVMPQCQRAKCESSVVLGTREDIHIKAHILIAYLLRAMQELFKDPFSSVTSTV